MRFAQRRKGARKREPPEKSGCRRWNDFLGIVQSAYVIHGTHRSNVLVDALALARESAQSRGEIETATIDDSAIVHFRYGTP